MRLPLKDARLRALPIVLVSFASAWACGVTLTGDDSTAGVDASNDAPIEAPSSDGGIVDGPSADTTSDAGCPGCTTFDHVTALVASNDYVFVGHGQGVSRCNATKCESSTAPNAGAHAIVIEGGEVWVVTGRQIVVCNVDGPFGCMAQGKQLPAEAETAPPKHLVLRPNKVYWTSAASDALFVVERATLAVGQTLSVSRFGMPLVRSALGVTYAAAPALYELGDDETSGIAQSEVDGKFKSAADLAYGSGRLAVILQNGNVSQCTPKQCTSALMFDHEGAAATDITIALGSVYWSSRTSNEIRKMAIDTADVKIVANVPSPSFLAVTSTHVFVATGPNGSNEDYTLRVFAP